jgi:hypothetical protein
MTLTVWGAGGRARLHVVPGRVLGLVLLGRNPGSKVEGEPERVTRGPGPMAGPPTAGI